MPLSDDSTEDVRTSSGMSKSVPRRRTPNIVGTRTEWISPQVTWLHASLVFSILLSLVNYNEEK
jgi:hypothetical protein